MPNISSKLRRIVTGQNAQGRSCVFLDGPPAEDLPLRGHEGLQEIWTLLPGPLYRSEALDRGRGKVTLAPPSQGVKFRWFTLEPTSNDKMPEADAEAQSLKIFEMIDGLDKRPDTSRHPSMHLTQTIDLIILLKGNVRLLLDDDDRVISPGDVVVQRGTNHAWICESEEPALLVAVLIDKDFAD